MSLEEPPSKLHDLDNIHGFQTIESQSNYLNMTEKLAEFDSRHQYITLCTMD